MNETEDVIYKSYYKTLDRPPLNDIVKTKKGLHLYRKLQAEIKHFQRIQNVTFRHPLGGQKHHLKNKKNILRVVS
tara:strand:- start:3401 stop:3625 length:225 start_codon:yes stop_codon:yes gene_type:complete